MEGGASEGSTVRSQHQFLKLKGDLSIRRTAEGLEASPLYREVARKTAGKVSKKPSRKEAWELLLRDPSSAAELESLSSLLEADQAFPVAGLMSDLHDFASKSVHTTDLDEALVDLDSYTPLQALGYCILT